MGSGRLGVIPSFNRAAVAVTAAAVCAIVALPSPAPAATTPAKPNIIVITTDDQRQDDLSVMTKVKAELIDKGVTFDNSLASYSLCCPSRTTFLTGQYMHNHGVTWNFWPEGGYFKFKHSTNDGGWSNILPTWLQNAGYRTGLIGKYLNQTGEDDPTTAVARTATARSGATSLTVTDASGLRAGDHVAGTTVVKQAAGSRGSTQVTLSESAAGIYPGDFAVGAGFFGATTPITVQSVSGSTVKFSAPLVTDTTSITLVRPGIEPGTSITSISGNTLRLSNAVKATLSGTGNITTTKSNPLEVPPGWNEWIGGVDPTTYSYYGYTFNVNGRSLKTFGNCRHIFKTVDPMGLDITPPKKTPFTSDKTQGCYEENSHNDVYLQNTNSDSKYQTNVEATYAETFIKSNGAKSTPYFLWVTPTAPHTTTTTGAAEGSPAIPPYKYKDLFADKQLPAWPAFNEADVSDKPAIQNFFPWFPALNSDLIRVAKSHYQKRQAALMGVDDMVGRIMTAVRSTGKASNTLIIFTSDNGWLLGEHRILAQKQFGFEESIRVPLVIAGPGFTGGKRSAPIAINADLAPTILRAAGATAGRPMDGVALQDLLSNPAGWMDRTVVIETGANPRVPTYAGIHNRRYHLEIITGGGLPDRYELYDLSKDPFEMNAVQDDPAYAGVLAQLIAQDRRLASCKGSNCIDTGAIPASPTSSSLDDVSMTTGLHTGVPQG